MGSFSSLKQESIDFFELFSRAEYCLKVAGFCGADRNFGAYADWDRFAESIPALYGGAYGRAADEAIYYLIENPPKKQFFRDGNLGWEESKYKKINNKNIFLYIRRVRNNLFHGGKFNGHWFEPQRSHDLLAASILILKVCIEASKLVKDAYDGSA